MKPFRLPIALFFAVYYLNPEYIMLLFTEELGRKMIAVAVVLQILGAITIGTGIGAASGAWMAGWIFDLTGSYHVAFGLSIFFYACGGVAFWLLRRPPAVAG